MYRKSHHLDWRMGFDVISSVSAELWPIVFLFFERNEDLSSW